MSGVLGAHCAAGALVSASGVVERRADLLAAGDEHGLDEAVLG
jgi:hypothetical protein